MEGYKYWFKEQSLVSIWSAVNYTYRCGNDASIMTIDSNLDRRFDLFRPSNQKKNHIHYQSVMPYFL